MRQTSLALQGYKCFLCGAKSPQKETICPNEDCHSLHTMMPVKSQENGEETTPTVARRAKKASSIAAADFEKISTGTEAWDAALDGGLVRPSSLLVYGDPGIGKSTQSILIAAHVALSLDEPVLYGSAEMPDSLFVHIARNRLNLSKQALDRIYVTDTNDLATMLAEIEEIQPAMVVWDSMQRFRSEGEEGEAVLKRVVHDALEAGQDANAITMLVSQVTKGEDFAGRNTIRHDVDCEVSMSKVRDGIAVQVLDKNRFGRTPLVGTIPVHWEIPFVEETQKPKRRRPRNR
ncbi:MAG: DNA repair protein RadA [Methanomicrobiales archaeon]|nr:DNA repair protein RadA [Methanomicrobiales archaeon]